MSEGTSGNANVSPVLERLDEAECLRLISPGGIGRIAFTGRYGLTVLPVNYIVDGGTIVYRTTPDSVIAAPVGTEVAFEVDYVNEHLSQGWSVLLVGAAEHITDGFILRPGKAGVSSSMVRRTTCPRMPSGQPWWNRGSRRGRAEPASTRSASRPPRSPAAA